MKAWRHQPLTVRLLAVSAGLLTAAAAFAAPAEAGPIDDAFIAALNNAGVNYGDAANAVALGQAVCPILAQPGGSFNTAAASVVAGTSGMDQQMAETFTSIAISMYCPQVMADLARGNVPALPQLPGIPAF
ncbi:DUF732 domain-containing protein [Mycobacterium shinjukuense]|uniref:Uncharacterized protein n=1 Tax=Mycobacterium shinjukuense TaxID=398694 RepID=A0A7I7MRE9_9MYCO|nr:DUF732 domain-containing protein [Mycobacterium shinjukuense]MCV6987401.1 DUF732 domain-containing protein [Mycobacterium shinjukuense]ORB65955.1 hypothetical protein BST45_14275 [Mycobacterium shinjukuense]BBX74686.1 hypothetical protein MSHI_25920 [Mycobacterium shinjukuense]